LRAPQHEATGCCQRGQSRDRQGRRRGISFDANCERLGNPDFISAEELADIIVFCSKQPQRICIRDIVVMPATSSFA
jgi:NADP-dependent 3-hydroxy acid dehydrogenase YdfG